jgi:PIN domain nuclease of toxin-antitoxin system
MKLLLDTHLLLWTAEGSKRMPAGARTLIAMISGVVWGLGIVFLAFFYVTTMLM